MKKVKFKGQNKNFKKKYDTNYGENGQRIRGVVEFKNGVAENVPDVVASYLCENELFEIQKPASTK